MAVTTQSGERRVGSTAQSVAVGAAVLLSATAFSGVLADGTWWFPSLVMVAAIAAIGAVTRRAGWWSPLIAVTQLGAVCVLVVTLFSDQAVLGVLPGPASVGEVAGLLGQAGEVVRSGVPPVPATVPLQALLALGLGLVTVLIDVLAVSVGTPAVAGLVLLCLYALPASLADMMLPWWSFAAGAAGFAGLLVTGGKHHSLERGRESGRTALRHQAFGVGAVATVLALLTSAAFTGVGTDGSLPGSRDRFSDSTEGIGIRPFTSLRGQLNRDKVVELFRVRGLPQDAYLRAMTLRRFDPERGWELDGLTQGVAARGALPYPEPGTLPPGREVTVEIEPLGYRDPWLPAYGVPLEVSGMGEDWRYDPAAGILFTQKRQPSRPYTERFLLPDPAAAQLRAADSPPTVDPAYLDTTGITPEIADLARRVTANEGTDFDRAVALNRLFTEPSNGFRYELTTAPATSTDALSDFLFRGKQGYCEQFASSMAVLLRTLGIPSRVAVGFTAGTYQGSSRTITTDDAHAWVEAYLPGTGWTTFDPTPLDDGRTALPNYLREELNPPVGPEPAPQEPTPSPGATPPPGPTQERPEDAGAVPGGPPGSGGSGWWGPLLATLVLLLAASGAPAAFRVLRRQQRLRATAEGSATAAWSEVMDQSWDRGTSPATSETARVTASRLIAEHGLDAEGARALRELVTAVERDWYAPENSAPGGDLSALLQQVLAGFGRSAPLSWQDRALPRSVLRTSG